MAKSRWIVRPLEGRMTQLKIHLSGMVDGQGSAFAAQLRSNIARGHRSGPIYRQFGNLYPSSVPGEYPQEQSSNLRSSVGAKNTGEITLVNAGFFADLAIDPGRLRGYLGEIEGFPIGNATEKSRAPLRMTGESSELLDALRDAVIRWGGG